jgi:hypothetical protein
MEEPDCFALRIPARLHLGDKSANQDFSNSSEELYRRCSPDKGPDDVPAVITLPDISGGLSASVF